MWGWLLRLLFDKRGDDPGQGDGSGDGSGDAPSGDGSGDGTGGDGQGGDGSGDGSGTSKYGEFGDNPTVDQLYEKFTKTQTDFDNFRKKAGLTESNLGKLRQTLATAGIEIGEDGQLKRKVAPGQERKARFTDSHKQLFDSRVLEAMQFFVEDMLDNRFTNYDKRNQQQNEFQRVMHASIDKMYKLYPQLNKEINGDANPDFNEAFFTRANEILQEQYRNLPNGDLLAAHEAAIELGISPVAIEKAKKDGFQRGTNNKRVLGPVKGGGQKAPEGKLSKEEYLKLSPEEKAEHDRKYILSSS